MLTVPYLIFFISGHFKDNKIVRMTLVVRDTVYSFLPIRLFGEHLQVLEVGFLILSADYAADFNFTKVLRPLNNLKWLRIVHCTFPNQVSSVNQ